MDGWIEIKANRRYANAPANKLPTRYRTALLERIASKAARARADRRVVDHATVGIVAARARARVDAALIDARAVARALRVRHTLGLAVGRCADVQRLAGADGTLADNATFAVGATRRWTARIRGWYVVDLGVRIASNFVCVCVCESNV